MQNETWHRSLSIAWMRRLCSPFYLHLLPFFIVYYMTAKRLFLSFLVNFLLQRIVSTWYLLMRLRYVSCFFVSLLQFPVLLVIINHTCSRRRVWAFEILKLNRKWLICYFVLKLFLIEIIYLNLYDTLNDWWPCWILELSVIIGMFKYIYCLNQEWSTAILMEIFPENIQNRIF